MLKSIVITEHASSRLYSRFGVNVSPYTEITATSMKRSKTFTDHKTGDELVSLITKIDGKIAVLVTNNEDGRVKTVLGPTRSPEFDAACRQAGVNPALAA